MRNIILFIDDDEVCHTLLNLIIPHYTNLKLLSAYTGQNAIELLNKYKSAIAIVISDFILPDISGRNIYDIMLADQELSNIPFCLQTGINDVVSHFSPNIQVLMKPYSKDELLTLLKKAVPTANID